MAYVVIAVLFGLAGGIVGRLKGSSFFIWFLISAIVPVIGLIVAIAYPSQREEMRRVCPGCGKVVKLHDSICTRCGTELEYPQELVAPEAWGRPVQAGAAGADGKD